METGGDSVCVGHTEGTASELRTAVRRFTELLGGNEWAEHLSADKDAMELELQITRVIGELEALRRQVRAQVSGSVVQREPVRGSDSAADAPPVGQQVLSQPRLTVRLASFPESNGKRNWTALLVRADVWGGLVGNCGGVCLAQGELWNRVAYHAECARLLIGERDTEPHILDYGDDIATPEEWAGEVRGGRVLGNRC